MVLFRIAKLKKRIKIDTQKMRGTALEATFTAKKRASKDIACTSILLALKHAVICLFSERFIFTPVKVSKHF